MLYEQISEKPEGKGQKLTRTYRNTKTGTEIKMQVIHQSETTGRWWGFNDLYQIPYMRMAMVANITNLYTIGLTLKDIKTWCEEEKKLLKSDDPEKYEKLYSLILEKEQLATTTANPIRQQVALCTVYVLSDDERIDYFDTAMMEEKISLWKSDNQAVAFFLTWHTGHIQRYIRSLEKTSEIYSRAEKKYRDNLAR